MRTGADLRGGTPLVSFDHVIDPHVVTFSSSLYTTICTPNPNPNTYPNPTVITDPQIGHINPQIVIVQIRSADLLRRRADRQAGGNSSFICIAYSIGKTTDVGRYLSFLHKRRCGITNRYGH